MKRKILRNQNWSVEEKAGLLNQLKNHIDIIENKDPYLDMIDLRKRTWQNIHHEMKKKCISSREVIRLKEAWSRMKSNAKMEMSTFAAMMNKHGIQAAFRWRPSNLSIEVNRLLQSVKSSPCGTPKIKKELDTTVHLLQILDSHLPSVPLERNTCQAKEEDPLAHMKNENPENIDDERSLSPIQICLNENIKILNDTLTRPIVDDTRKRHIDIQEYPEDNNEDIISFAEIEYTKEDNRSSWSYDASNEEHKIRLQLLNTELARAELQKQTASNELKISDIKLQLAEAQANDYQRFGKFFDSIFKIRLVLFVIISLSLQMY